MRPIAIPWALACLVVRVLSDDSLKALEIPASQHFEGNDGPWSTFDLRVGTPEQYLRVLVSTASPESMVVLDQYGCSTQVFTTVPPNCAVSRGSLFDQTKSSSWQDMGTYGINGDGIGLEANLGYNATVNFALEDVGIGLQGPSFGNQTVAGLARPSPFYLGVFGLNGQPVNFTTLGNYSAPSFLNTLKDQKKIPSLSWSYTAGAKYRLKQVYGQLIFSGYDTSRFEQNEATFTMADDLTRDLVVSLQSISYSGSSSATLLSKSIDTFIDSTDPNLWLPSDACDAFEKAFGLTLDKASGMYLVNDTQRDANLNSDAEVTFRLSDVRDGGETVSITFPYAAFDLTAEAPLVSETSHYFPLKRANDSTQYTLGRVFLQEAYLTADYERKVFNVSACAWNEGAQENLITINPKDAATATSAGGASAGSSGGSRLGGGQIAGVVIGSVAGVLLMGGAIAVFVLRKRRKWIKAGYAANNKTLEPDESMLKGPVFNSADRSRSTAVNSSPFSPGDISGQGSAAGYSASNSRSATSAAGIAAVGAGVGGAGAGAAAAAGGQELDGHETRVVPRTELDGREIGAHGSAGDGATRPVARNPGVYELPGTEVGGTAGRGVSSEMDRPPSTVPTLPSIEGNSPPSPMTSTMASDWRSTGGDWGNTVSPDTPAHRGTERF